ncbi:MAG: GAF domain-containing protein [Bryobacteraceae bacterium]|nr:GAF domain-containing protein [Bryobacteraceae bacterium]MDW8377909.1 GAF domain-containing protein [Bryobacterales bacterium]
MVKSAAWITRRWLKELFGLGPLIVLVAGGEIWPLTAQTKPPYHPRTDTASQAQLTAPAPLVLTLEQANSRRPGDRQLIHQGRLVAIQGQVAGRAVRYEDFAHLPLVDSTGWGLTVEAPDYMFDRLAPGEWVEVRGLLAQRFGLPIVRPIQLTTTHRSAPPKIERVGIGALESEKFLGRVLEIRGRVAMLGEDAVGQYILLENGMRRSYPVYLPRSSGTFGAGLKRFRVGDQVQATGLVSVWAPEASGTPSYRLVLDHPSALVLMERAGVVAPQIFLGATASILLALLLVLRHRRLKRNSRRGVRKILTLCEELLTAGNMEELLRKLRTIVPRALGVSAVQVYRYDRGSDSLIRMGGEENSTQGTIPLEAEAGTVEAALALCYRNRTPLYIPKTAGSRLLFREHPAKLPSTLVFLPMFAKEELVGVLWLERDKPQTSYSEDELGALQHFANQFALVIKIVEQQAHREYLARSEKLAVTGQLISGVASELRAPLESIFAISHRMLDAGESQARAILMESLKVSSILSRLNEVVGPQQSEAGTLEVNQTLQGVLDNFDYEQCMPEVEIETRLSREPLWTVGVANQLADVLGNLILLACQAAAQSPEPKLVIETGGNSRRLLVAIRYGSVVYDEIFPPLPPRPGRREALSFSLCRGILHSLGGEVRIQRAGETSCRMEIELPAVIPTQKPVPARGRGTARAESLTAIVLEPDLAAQRRLVSFLADRNHRAIPLSSEGEAFELLRRMRIDVIFCAVRTGSGPMSGNWADFFDRARSLARTFVLLSDSVDTDASTLFPHGEGYVLHKPLETGELERLLDRLESKQPLADTSSPAETSDTVAT